MMHIPVKIKHLSHINANCKALGFEHKIVELLGRTTMRYTHVRTQTITKVTSPLDKLRKQQSQKYYKNGWFWCILQWYKHSNIFRDDINFVDNIKI